MLFGDDTPAVATDQDQVAWYNAWGQLKLIVAQLDAAEQSLTDNREFALSRPNLASQYNDNMDLLASLRSKALWVRDQVQAAFDYFGITLSGIRRQAQQLGFLPLIVWPIVAAAVAWLGSKALDLWKFSQQVDEQRRVEQQLISAGVPVPQAVTQAAKSVQQKQDAGFFGGAFDSVAPLLVIGAVGFGVWYLFFRKGRS